MALNKIITIDEKEVKFRASATVPRLYRHFFKRDIFKDIKRLTDAQDAENIEIMDLELFENMAYIMAKHADGSIPATAEEWLEDFSTFSIYEVLPELLKLWGENMYSEVEVKKKQKQLQG